jgi:hypothetical protein
MVDYFPVLDRAVAALNPNTREARRVLYDRARRALVDGLRASDPTLSDTDLKTQSSALEAAIRRVETEALRRAAEPAPAPVPTSVYEPAPPATPDEGYEDQPPLKESRRPMRMVATAMVAMVVLIAGAAAYVFWPSRAIPPSQRGVAGKGIESEAWGAAPYVYLRQPVYYRTTHPAGTIVVDKSQSFLYVVRPSLSALRYGIGVGPECNTTAGLYQVVRKEEWPGLKVPSGKQLSDEERNRNPFGARALYLSKESRIHGTNTPASIGRPGTLGCFRLTNDDVIHLYERAPLETRVVVLN